MKIKCKFWPVMLLVFMGLFFVRSRRQGCRISALTLIPYSEGGRGEYLL